jgi:16S rRNA A1518/A1519 N6-dimethyltransferase RsmA/KsgA/DIM1 with predicted DNA glycosylase/AP lyase activity
MSETNKFESNPELGQHFLIDKKIIEKTISESNLSKEDMVIEVGAGKGALTEKLAEKSKEVLSFEIDSMLSIFLDVIEKKHKNLKVVYGDALKFSWKGYNKIVSNSPYSLAEPVIKKAIDENIEELILIVGENFKEVAQEGRSKAGIITNLFFDFKSITQIGKESFSPKPRVDSFLVSLQRKRKLTKEERVLQSIVTKKGKIKNAIISSLVSEGMTKNQSRDLMGKMNFHDDVLNKPVGSITGRVLLEIRKGLKNLR